MSTSITIRRYLEKQDIRFKSVSYDSNAAQLYRSGTQSIAARKIAKAVILKDLQGMLMAVIPGPLQLEMNTINQRFKRNLVPAKQEDYAAIFSDCNSSLIPPLGEAYGLECVVDDSLLDNDKIYFVSGNQHELLCVTTADFQWLHNNAWYGNTFCHIAANKHTNTQASLAGPYSANHNLPEHALPSLSKMAKNIIALRNNPLANSEDLAHLVEKDSALAAQISQYAQSRFYGVSEQITSIQQAISRVLGYELAINIALGIAASHCFKANAKDLHGLHAYWRHATYSATLAQGLAYCMSPSKNAQPGTAYLCGLLHNSGTLVLGHAFPNKLIQLRQTIALYPDISVLEHEINLLDTTHTLLGQQLMRSWKMPNEIIASTAEHHNKHYSGPYAQYANILYITDALLKRHDLGDACDTGLPQHILRSLGLSSSQVLGILEKTLQGSSELDTMARKLAA